MESNQVKYYDSEVHEVDEESRKVQFIISDDSRDRYGTSVNMTDRDWETMN